MFFLHSIKIEINCSTKDKLLKLWFNYWDKTSNKFTTWLRTFSDMTETMTAKLPTMNWLISASNNTSDRLQFKDYTGIKATIKDVTRDKWTNKNLVWLLIMLLIQSIFKPHEILLTCCSARLTWTSLDGLLIKFISFFSNITSEVRILSSERTSS